MNQGKGRSQRPSDLLRDYLEGLSSEHAGLVAQRDFLVAWIELVERQRANVQEAIEIDRKLAEMGQRSLSALETLARLQQGEAAIAP